VRSRCVESGAFSECNMHPVQKALPTQLQKYKEDKRKITMLSSYDYALAMLADRAGLDTILVGDSLAMTALGYPSTVAVTGGDAASHTRRRTRRQAGYGCGQHALHVLSGLPAGSRTQCRSVSKGSGCCSATAGSAEGHRVIFRLEPSGHGARLCRSARQALAGSNRGRGGDVPHHHLLAA
jgi:Ketopantoate hydroxymethyltransferase